MYCITALAIQVLHYFKALYFWYPLASTILHLEDPPAPHLPQESDHVGVSGPGQRQQPVAPGEVAPAKGLAPVEREGPRHEEEEGPAGQEHDRAHGGLVWSFGKDSSMKESTSGRKVNFLVGGWDLLAYA